MKASVSLQVSGDTVSENHKLSLEVGQPPESNIGSKTACNHVKNESDEQQAQEQVYDMLVGQLDCQMNR